jgi:hypothetical protein
MTNGPTILIDLVVIATLEGLVSEEVDLLVLNARQLLFVLDVL